MSEVTDAMVERAMRSWVMDTEPGDFYPYRMRKALEAAIDGHYTLIPMNVREGSLRLVDPNDY